jgi:hypothetical protein
MLLTQLPATPDIVFVPPPEELPELEEELLEELELLFLNFFIAIVVCFCHCCSTTVTPGGYGVDRVSVVARLAICYIAPLDGGTTYAIRATSTLNTPIHRRRIVVVATAVATGKCSSSAWGCWLWLHYRRLGCYRSLRSRRDDY